jgi:hypothetical protein
MKDTCTYAYLANLPENYLPSLETFGEFLKSDGDTPVFFLKKLEK